MQDGLQGLSIAGRGGARRDRCFDRRSRRRCSRIHIHCVEEWYAGRTTPIAFEREGDRIEIQEATEIEVSFATIRLYTFEHQAREVWETGRALRIDSTTNDNGETLNITVRPGDHGYIRTVNGRVDRFDGSMRILGFWDKEILKHHKFFSTVEDKSLKVSFQRVGWEKITVAGKALDADHYRMVGDEERDLWFDADGHLARAEFRRHGSAIGYVRDQLAPLRPVPAASCTIACVGMQGQ